MDKMMAMMIDHVSSYQRITSRSVDPLAVNSLGNWVQGLIS